MPAHRTTMHHCKSEAQAKQLRAEFDARFAACNLQFHPEKTKIVYCKDDNRRGSYLVQRSDFVGYCFRSVSVLGNGGVGMVLPILSRLVPQTGSSMR